MSSSSNLNGSQGSISDPLDFWKWHEQTIEATLKKLNQRESSLSSEVKSSEVVKDVFNQSSPVPKKPDSSNTSNFWERHETKTDESLPKPSVFLSDLFKSSFVETPSKEDLRLREVLMELEKFSSEPECGRGRAKTLYSRLEILLIIPVDKLELGGEWSTPYDLKRSCQKYVDRFLSDAGYPNSSTKNLISFIERYMKEFPKLHRGE